MVDRGLTDFSKLSSDLHTCLLARMVWMCMCVRTYLEIYLLQFPANLCKFYQPSFHRQCELSRWDHQPAVFVGVICHWYRQRSKSSKEKQHAMKHSWCFTSPVLVSRPWWWESVVPQMVGSLALLYFLDPLTRTPSIFRLLYSRKFIVCVLTGKILY